MRTQCAHVPKAHIAPEAYRTRMKCSVYRKSVRIYIALEYGELKMELAYRFSEDIEGYCTGKDAFVKQLEKDALLWYQNNESYKTR